MESFERLAAQYQPMIHKIIRTLSIYKNLDEFYQIGLIALWDASNRYDSNKGNFMNYAYTFIKGRILTELSRSRKLEERNIFQEEEFWDLIPDSVMEQSLESDVMDSLCYTLTTQQRKWLEYTCLECLTINEIAQREEVSVSAVKNWRAGARRKLSDRKIEF